MSPAGTLECGLAAFQYGADAVYLGMKEFSARADAGNFSFEELSVLVGYAHQVLERRRKVYVAVNTLVRETELGRLADLLVRLRDMDVDALIVQDAAVVQMVRQYDLGLELHASTQMAVHNVEGVRQAQRLGFTRVVAAREVSINELAAMAAVPGMEIEAFIHGALCYSYSGLCLMSACTNGCSGNRGECTYVCRKRFEITDEKGGHLGSSCPMSMKDLALGDALAEMRRAGVASLKIEGRKKTPLYVAAVTNLYRKLLDKSFGSGEEQEAKLDVKTIFSRPWTELFAHKVKNTGVTDPVMLGPRGIEIGQVARVRRGENGDWLRFTVRMRPIEKHDGLQVEIPGIEKPYGFGVDDLRSFKQGGQDRWEAVFEARPGSIIEVPLPDGHPEIPVGSKVCCASSQAVKRKYKWPEARDSLWRLRHPASFSVHVESSRLSVEMVAVVCGRKQPPVQVAMDLDAPLSVARQPEKVADEVTACFSRLGDSAFSLEKVTCDNPDKLFVPKGMLNELRRMAVARAQEQLDEATSSLSESIQKDIVIQNSGQGDDRKKQALYGLHQAGQSTALEASGANCEHQELWSLKIDNPALLNALDDKRLNGFDEVVFSLERSRADELTGVLGQLQERLGDCSRIRLSLPVLCRGRSAAQWGERAKELVSAGWRKWEVANVGTLELFQGLEADVTADWPLYAMNSLAARYWLEHGVNAVAAAPEDTSDNMLALAEKLGNKLVVPIFQHTALARSAVCVMSSIRGFCPGKANCTFTKLSMKTNRSESFIAVNNNCNSIIVNNEPLDYAFLIPELRKAGACRFRIELLWLDYSANQIMQLIDSIRSR